MPPVRGWSAAVAPTGVESGRCGWSDRVDGCAAITANPLPAPSSRSASAPHRVQPLPESHLYRACQPPAVPWTVEQVQALADSAARAGQGRPGPCASRHSARRREQRIQSGVDDLDRWLQDLARRAGEMACGRGRPSTRWPPGSSTPDAGLARMVRDLGATPTHHKLAERMLVNLGHWRCSGGVAQTRYARPGPPRPVRGLVGINGPASQCWRSQRFTTCGTSSVMTARR